MRLEDWKHSSDDDPNDFDEVQYNYKYKEVSTYDAKHIILGGS